LIDSYNEKTTCSYILEKNRGCCSCCCFFDCFLVPHSNRSRYSFRCLSAFVLLLLALVPPLGLRAIVLFSRSRAGPPKEHLDAHSTKLGSYTSGRLSISCLHVWRECCFWCSRCFAPVAGTSLSSASTVQPSPPSLARRRHIYIYMTLCSPQLHNSLLRAQV